MWLFDMIVKVRNFLICLVDFLNKLVDLWEKWQGRGNKTSEEKGACVYAYNYNFALIQRDNHQLAGYLHESNENNARSTLELFESYIEQGKEKWSRRFIGYQEVLAFKDDEFYQVTISDKYEPCEESWTKCYPDKINSGKYEVYLRVSGQAIASVWFVYADGGRINFPLPKARSSENGNELAFYWQRQSIEFKLAQLIGSFDIYENIETIAKRSGIKIT